MNLRVTASIGPALGDVRSLGRGDALWVGEDATQRKDWPRYADAIAVAVTRGAEIRQTE